MNEKSLHDWLSYFTDRTRTVIRGQAEFFTMVFIITQGEIRNELLFPMEDDIAGNASARLPLFHGFLGAELAADEPALNPDFVFVAEMLLSGDDRELILVDGCAADGARARDAFLISRTRWRRRLRAGESVDFGPKIDYNPATEVLRGIRQHS